MSDTSSSAPSAVDHGLSPQQLMALEAELLQARDALLRASRETERHLQSFLAISDADERGQQAEEHRMDLTVQEREKLQLQRIDQALQRIRDGSYGYCAVSGEPIGIDRLKAQPTATLSRAAQEKLEARQKRS